jgi:diaminohydroxyphosphoribosylaminopyrimidine deaminase/5-amino-6-(5-phosphoribosylamino)uracil reductase
VVIGAGDPDPQVSGRGVAILESAGVMVSSGVLADEVVAADPGYFHHRRTGMALLHLKMASTLDGQVAAADGTSKWLTTAEARRDAHVLRASCDAVMVGAGTVIADDPLLSVRLDGYDGPQPRPVVVAGVRPLPASKVFDRNPLVYSTRSLDVPGEVVVIPGDGHRIDPSVMAKDLGDRGLLTVLVEGGPTLVASLMAAGLVGRITTYLGPLFAGGVGWSAGIWESLSSGRRLEYEGVAIVGGTVRVDAAVVV